MNGQLASVLSFVGDRPPVALPAAPGARVVVVGSGKGGVGTSTVASLLGLVLAAAGERVLLVDGVDGLGAQHLLLDAPNHGSTGAIGLAATDNRDSIIRVTNNLALVPALDPGDGAGSGAGADHRTRLRRLSGSFSSYDIVVVDGGSRLASVLAACEAGVDLLLVVSTTERICLAANYALVKAIGTRLGERPVAVLGNRMDAEAADEAGAMIDSACRHFLERIVVHAGALPDDACLAAGVAAGMPIQDAAEGSPAAAAMRLIAGRLLDTIPSSPTPRGRLHSRSS